MHNELGIQEEQESVVPTVYIAFHILGCIWPLLEMKIRRSTIRRVI